MRGGAPVLEGLVGGEEHGAAAEMAVVDDMEEHVGGVAADAEVADFADHEDGVEEIVEEGGSGGEEGVEAMPDGLVGGGDDEVSLAAVGRVGKTTPTFLPRR